MSKCALKRGLAQRAKRALHDADHHNIIKTVRKWAYVLDQDDIDYLFDKYRHLSEEWLGLVLPYIPRKKLLTAPPLAIAHTAAKFIVPQRIWQKYGGEIGRLTQMQARVAIETLRSPQTYSPRYETFADALCDAVRIGRVGPLARVVMKDIYKSINLDGIDIDRPYTAYVSNKPLTALEKDPLYVAIFNKIVFALPVNVAQTFMLACASDLDIVLFCYTARNPTRSILLHENLIRLLTSHETHNLHHAVWETIIRMLLSVRTAETCGNPVRDTYRAQIEVRAIRLIGEILKRGHLYARISSQCRRRIAEVMPEVVNNRMFTAAERRIAASAHVDRVGDGT